MNRLPFAIAPLRPSVSYMIFATSPWLALYCIFLPCVFFVHILFLLPSLFVLLAFLYHFFWLCADLYVITPEMYMVSTGLMKKTVTWLNPQEISDFKITQNRVMRYFGISHLTLISNDEIHVQFTMRGIDNMLMKEALQLTIDHLKAKQEYYKLLVDLGELLKKWKEQYGK